MELPIANLLKRRAELETARLEDDVISMLSNITDEFALHGSTAVWRCYGGESRQEQAATLSKSVQRRDKEAGPKRMPLNPVTLSALPLFSTKWLFNSRKTEECGGVVACPVPSIWVAYSLCLSFASSLR